MNMRFLKSLAPVLLMPIALSAPALTQASFVSCVGDGYNISGYVTPNMGCGILEPINGNFNDSEALVNGETVNVNNPSPPPGQITYTADPFFGFSDWILDGKYDQATQGGPYVDGSSIFDFRDSVFDGDGGLLSGKFTYAGGFSLENVMLVFKDGGSTNLVAYLIDMDALLSAAFNGTGEYQSPFVEPPFSFPGSGPRQISHISVYYRENGDTPPTGVHEPGLVLLFGTGLLIMGWAVRRRHRLEDEAV